MNGRQVDVLIEQGAAANALIVWAGPEAKKIIAGIVGVAAVSDGEVPNSYRVVCDSLYYDMGRIKAEIVEKINPR